MKIKAISDNHGYLPDPSSIGKCDVLCICGDIMPLSIQRNFYASVLWYTNHFRNWVNKLNCEKVILTPGNHDFFFEMLEKIIAYKDNQENEYGWVLDVKTLNHITKRDRNDKIVYLVDELFVYKGVRFYGTPYVSSLKNWAFYRSDVELKERFNKIPEKVDVLLTHQPPKLNDCGLVKQTDAFHYLSDFGSDILADAIMKRDIKWALSGHVHSGSHVSKKVNNTNIVNVSLKDENYKVSYDLFEFDIHCDTHNPDCEPHMYVVRNPSSQLWLFDCQPWKDENDDWDSFGNCMPLDENMFPNVTCDDKPLEVVVKEFTDGD